MQAIAMKSKEFVSLPCLEAVSSDRMRVNMGIYVNGCHIESFEQASIGISHDFKIEYIDTTDNLRTKELRVTIEKRTSEFGYGMEDTFVILVVNGKKYSLKSSEYKIRTHLTKIYKEKDEIQVVEINIPLPVEAHID